MKILISELLANHYKETGEYITINILAGEMTEKGIFKNLHSAKNMLYYNNNGRAKSLDIQILEFLMKRFNKDLNQIIKS